MDTWDAEVADCLVFKPTGSHSWIQETFQYPPRYLYRVATPRSEGQTTQSWAKSKDATNSRASSQKDLFSRSGKQMANMLDRHLGRKESKFDNFVSWTSSLLYAIQYIFSRHHEERTPLDKIMLYIVDTTKFPAGVFIRDMDLLAVYSPFNAGLQKLQCARSPVLKDAPPSSLPEFLRASYFGEYLSQGALRIEGRCSAVSAQDILDAGLLDLRVEFKASRRFNLGLDERVKHLRKAFAQCDDLPRDIEREIRVAVAIGNLFGPDWSVSVAASLMALRPCRGEDLLVICRELLQYFPSKCVVH
ncbi:hypothetical protein N7492_006100 [Penicillium capsulatum]|uniref:DUF7587 domain-containing protein n=1 Tax=Penicillium capsulatum TaxID=69766 RepID=A0A9W9LLE0_9EURO|nr:hypothetical protein N7492_006100 [Penicillium capsulatum]KAJ6108750.1 hypothetical protein N7512_008587 [Penicillium capsulatum]